MSLVKLLTTGALGLVAYKAWQHYQKGPATAVWAENDASPSAPVRDARSNLSAHGDSQYDTDPVEENTMMGTPAAAGAQSSRGFGEV